MSGLVLHDTTVQQLAAYLARPSHALLLLGQEGMGKAAVARQLAGDLLQQESATLDNYPYLLQIEALDGRSITIEQVRSLGNFLSRRVPGNKSRIIIIEAADRLTTEAQNALLKTLEEPPEATFLLLSANHEDALLPTIRSRTRRLALTRPTAQQLLDHFSGQGFTAEQIQKANLMSGGLPGVMHALLHEDVAHPLVPAVQTARQLIQATTFERLAQVDAMTKDKIETQRILGVLQQMAHVALLQGATPERWQKIMTAAHEATNQLRGNAQPKLVLDNLMLAL